MQRILETEFPEFELEIIDIPDQFLRRRLDIVAVNVLQLIRAYALDLLKRRRTIRDAFYNSEYLFSEIKQFMRRRLGPKKEEYAFTFQTQSLFDASVPGIPHFVYTDHTNLANLYYPDTDGNRLFGEKWARLEGMIYSNAAQVFTMSRHVQRSVMEHYGVPADQVSCVGAGGNAVTNACPLDNHDYSNQRILFVGRYWERKGGPDLVEAFKIVLQTFPNAQLVIVGCSPELDLRNCEILGLQPPDAVAHQFSQASVFCMPSRVEPFGFVFLEALQSRIPIVATNIGALPDLVFEKTGGILVEPARPEKLAEALVTLLSNPALCRQLGEAGHALAHEHYTWGAVGRKMRTKIVETAGDRLKSTAAAGVIN